MKIKLVVEISLNYVENARQRLPMQSSVVSV